MSLFAAYPSPLLVPCISVELLASLANMDPLQRGVLAKRRDSERAVQTPGDVSFTMTLYQILHQILNLWKTTTVIKKNEILKSTWVGRLELKLNAIFHQIFHQILNLCKMNTLIRKHRNFNERMGRAPRIKIERYISPDTPPDIELMQNEHSDQETSKFQRAHGSGTSN
ncbi:hypothetical protein B0H10DRAFT_1958902 [Mycena sp. CBHHK59/15]|nr:hypothetical protein B0H10DRAFT_1958902 [Mycena sp. CBHHK59/15]